MSEIPDNITRLLRRTYPQSFTADSLAAQLQYTATQISAALTSLISLKQIVMVYATIDNGSGVQVKVAGVPVQYKATYSSLTGPPT
jgi:hypothetical protein